MQPTAAALQPVGNPARAASTQSTASGGREERKSMSTDRRHRVLRLFSAPVIAAALAAPVATAADGPDAILPQRCSPLRAAEHLRGSEPNRPQRHGSQPQPGSRCSAVSGGDRRSRRGRLRLDLRGASARRADPGYCSDSASPPSRCADASTLTLHRPDAPRLTSTPVRGRPPSRPPSGGWDDGSSVASVPKKGIASVGA